MNTEQDKRTLRLAKRIMNKNNNNNNNNRSRSSSSSRNNNKKHKKYRNVNNTTTNEYNKQVFTVSVGLPLTTMVAYLEPRDVLSCIQTCKEWKNVIDKDGVWREVAKVVSPNGVEAMTQAEATNNNKTGSMPEFNFRNMAIALSRTSSEYNPPVTVVDDLSQATLQLKDVLIVIEFRYRNKPVGALCRDLTELTEEKPGTQKSIKFDSSNAFNMGQLSSIIEDGWKNDDFKVTMRLVRRDTGKSFCIHDYQTIDYDGNVEYNPYLTQYLTPDAPNLSGIIARGLCHQHDYNDVRFTLDILMNKGSEDKIKYCELNLDVWEDDRGMNSTVFKSMNHFLLFLEGFHWK